MFQAVVVSSFIISFFRSMLLFRIVGMITYKNTDVKRMIVSNVGSTTRSENVCQGNEMWGVIMKLHRFCQLSVMLQPLEKKSRSSGIEQEKRH
jgi:hypothetical protein